MNANDGKIKTIKYLFGFTKISLNKLYLDKFSKSKKNIKINNVIHIGQNG